MQILVIGGTGMVGSQVTRDLLARGAAVKVLTRSPERVKLLPAGAAPVVGDLSQAGSLQAVLNGIDAVFLNIALSPDETEQGLAAVAAIQKSSARKVIYMSVHQLEAGAHIPHFGAKLPIEKAVRESGLAYTLLRPNNFFQNDLASKEALVKFGIYPQPMGNVGLSRVDVRDIAEAAAISLLERGHEGKVYSLVGPDVLTGDETARIYSRHLGREIKYAGDDLDAWSRQVSRFIPEWMVHDLRIMYESFQQKGLRATPQEVAELSSVLGHAPRSFDGFVSELTKSWS